MIMKNILDKINKAYDVEATKLGTHEVELALVDELNALEDRGSAIVELFTQNINKFEQLILSMEDITKKTSRQNEVVNNNKGLAQKWDNEVTKVYSKALDAAKQLGVNKNDIQGLAKLEKTMIAVQNAINNAQKIAKRF
jgi:hypothetical protein